MIIEKEFIGEQITQKELNSLVGSFSGWAYKRKGISVERYIIDTTKRRKGKKAKQLGVQWLIRNQQKGREDISLRILAILYDRAINKWGKVAYVKSVSSRRENKTSKMEERRRKYKEYLKSSWWKARRLSKIKTVGKCQVCASRKKLIVHHLFYSHNKVSILGAEQDSDLAVLCKPCHNRLHRKYGRGASFGIEIIRQERDIHNNIL